MTEIKPIYVIGGLGVVVVIFLILRKGGGGGPTIITAPAAADTGNPDQTRLAQTAIQADLFKNLAGLVYTQKGNDAASRVGLAQIEAGRQVGLAQTKAATEVASAQVTAATTQANLAAQLQQSSINAGLTQAGLAAQLQAAAIAAAQTVGLAQAQADVSRAQMQYDAQAAQQASQNRNNALQGILAQVGNVLRAIGAQQQNQPRPATGGGSGGASGGGASAPTTATRPRARTNPALPPAFPINWGSLLGGPTVDYSGVEFPVNTPNPIDYAAPPPWTLLTPDVSSTATETTPGWADFGGDLAWPSALGEWPGGGGTNAFDPWGEGFGYTPATDYGVNLPGTGGLDEIIGWLGASGTDYQPPPSNEAFDPWGEGFGYYEP